MIQDFAIVKLAQNSGWYWAFNTSSTWGGSRGGGRGWRVRSKPLNWNRWRQRNCKIFYNFTKKRDLKTSSWEGDLASKRQKSHFRGFEFPRMPPVPPKGEGLRRSYYRTPFCEILDLPQSMYMQIGDVLSRSVGQVVLFTLKAALSVTGRSAEGITHARWLPPARDWSRLSPSFMAKLS